jgi:hypothetical protein
MIENVPRSNTPVSGREWKVLAATDPSGRGLAGGAERGAGRGDQGLHIYTEPFCGQADRKIDAKPKATSVCS